LKKVFYLLYVHADFGNTDEIDPDAIALVKELDGLPLALSTTGAYLKHVTTSFSEYLRLYEASWLKLQTSSPKLNSYEDRSLYTTWHVTFDRIEQQNPASAKLLKLWAYFDRQDIWFELLQHGSSTDDEWIRTLIEDEINFNKAIRLLCEYGMVEANVCDRQLSGSGGYSVHSCMHSWTVFVLNKEWDETLARLALTCVASEVPSTNADHWWLLQRRLLQHATRQERFIIDGKVDNNGMDWALHNLATLYSNQGKLAEAEDMYIRALQGHEEALGPKHTSTLNTVNSLANLYSDQGKLAEAEEMYIRALQGKEEALGPKHISTLNTVNNLANLYFNRGKLAEAEEMYIQALQGKEEALGLKHISTLDTINNRAVLYSDQGKLAEAEEMYIRALQGKEEALGPKHTSTLDTVNNLAVLYSNQGKLAEAEEMYIQALQGCKEALGPKHTSTLSTVNNLANLYFNQGKLAEAEEMYIQALQGYEKALSLELVPSYIPALNTIVNLGNIYSETERTEMAKAMYIRALSGYSTVRGPLSDICKDLEGRLQVLQLTPTDSHMHQDASPETGAKKSKSLVQRLLRQVRR
jgi:tetratricopeptide (TPR) repeat protein